MGINSHASEDKTVNKGLNVKIFLEYVAGIILLLCIIAVVGAFSIYIWNASSKRDVTPQIISLEVNSKGALSIESQERLDSLTNIVLRHEKNLDIKYWQLLEQKENFNDILALGGLIVTIVISIFGFFGFKSMHNIEENVEKQSKRIAEDATNDAVKEKLEIYEDQLNNKIKAQIIEEKNSLSRELSSLEIKLTETLKEKAKDIKEESSKDISSIKADVKDLKDQTSNFDTEIVKLMKKVTKLEFVDAFKRSQRRTLKDMPPRNNNDEISDSDFEEVK